MKKSEQEKLAKLMYRQSKCEHPAHGFDGTLWVCVVSWCGHTIPDVASARPCTPRRATKQAG